eukprot:1888480-Prymnesium_polylepis.3
MGTSCLDAGHFARTGCQISALKRRRTARRLTWPRSRGAKLSQHDAAHRLAARGQSFLSEKKRRDSRRLPKSVSARTPAPMGSTPCWWSAHPAARLAL